MRSIAAHIQKIVKTSGRGKVTARVTGLECHIWEYINRRKWTNDMGSYFQQPTCCQQIGVQNFFYGKVM